MKFNLFKLITLTFILFTSYNCATYNTNYKKEEENWEANIEKQDAEIEHTFYLIGDAGNAELNESLSHLDILKNELKKASKNSTVLFLGDNIYEKGMPEETHPNRKLAEHKLNVQLNIVEGFKGNTIFIPGNHDYYSDGIKGLKRQQEYITDKLGNDSFLPKDGCPLEKVNISNETILLIVDTQWYLEDWNKNPTINDDCEIKTRAKFFDEFESLIKKNADKTVLIALHHPMFSNGNHGGQSSLKQQFHPFHNKVPLPILGTVANVLRKTSGISPQDMNNPLYLELKKRIITISQRAPKALFISGHEHNLQYIEKENKPQIVSGSGSKVNPVRTVNGSKFSYGGLGYAKVEVYKNGASQVFFYKEEMNKQDLIYSTNIFKSDIKKEITTYPESFPAYKDASIYSEKEVTKNGMFKLFWGDHYRKYYGTKINAKTVTLDTLMGGLIPTRKGGGNQSKSLRLEDKNGSEFVMRALRKSATQYIQAVAFKNQYVEGQFDDTYTESLLLDIYTTAHPYTPFVIGDLASAIDVFHANPTLFYVPNQQALKHYNTDFGDELYMIEERAASGHEKVASFGYSNKIISTDDLLKKLRKTDDNSLDEATYIRARLFDMLIGDWDRHEDQWRWAEFEDGKKTFYKPVPRDRDQAFSKNDGFILGFLSRAIPALKSLQVYDEDIRNVKWFNSAAYPLDMALLKTSTYKDWEAQINYIQKNLTSEVIEKAFKNIPDEVNDETILEIKDNLKGRLKQLNKIGKTYYKHLSKFAVITGTDKDNLFEIERLKNGITSVKIYNIKNNKKGSKISEKNYSKKETKEIWVYGLDDKDVFYVTGLENNIIPLRIIGGQNNDEYIIESGKKVTVYDYKTKKNTFTKNNGKTKLTNNYKTNTYNYKKLKYSQNQLIPSVGSNPDDGVKIGIKNIFTVYGFERNPFTQLHTLNAGYYFANKGFDVEYDAEFANLFDNWNFLVETKFTSSNYSINHFGFGNETTNFEDDFGEDYHRVRFSTYAMAPTLKWKGRFGATFKIGATFESNEIEGTLNRFINTLDYTLDKRKNFGGLRVSYNYENYDHKVFPTLGMHFSLDSGWKTNLKDNNENHAFITPSFGINYKLNPKGSIVLASKLKSNIIIGDNFEFYNAASIGGIDGLRGYRNQRFSGNTSFYQNSDLRFTLRKVKTELVPLQLGVFTGFDYGRVWLKNEKSNDWKTSYGGGFWLVAADLVNLNVSLFNSKDGAYLNLGLGFGF
jgi:predicted phosphohydrolase